MAENEIKLTQLATAGGCSAKIPAGSLARIVADLPVLKNERLMVGFDYADDAGVYRLNDELALIQTLDFFPPIVDDPFMFGQIAAANALSDVYAMGGRAITAMNIVAFPEDLDYAILGDILRGGAEKVKEAGAVLCGGHSIKDPEPKYGLSVTGTVHPEKVLSNSGACAGDLLILTKALGTGIITAAAKVELDSRQAFDDAAASMVHLNKYACEAMEGFDVHACTDITGFGFLGHLLEMTGASKTSALIYKENIPVLPAALEYAAEFMITCAAQRNRNHAGERVEFMDVGYAWEEVLFDPQTSGGLLISVNAEEASSLLEKIKKKNSCASIIGQVTEKTDKEIYIL